MIKKITFLLVLIGWQNVFAANDFDGGYFFTSLGQTNYADLTTNSDMQRLENHLLASPDVVSADLDADKTSTSFSLGMGYVFHKYLAVEASYQYLGSVKVSGTLTEDNNDTEAYSRERITAGFDIRTVLSVPIYKRFEAFVNWGALLWSRETKVINDSTDENSITKDNGLEVVFGGGVQYLIPNSFGFSVAWEQYNIAQKNVDVIKATLLYDFDIPL